MTTAMQPGDSVSGFTVLEITPLPRLQASGIWARHNITGLEVYHIYNDDEENLFSWCFMTPPEDSTGVAHILEHSVLCGSKHFPLKDPFLQLSRQSIKTYLNAMTFPDKTVYPASSMVETDYFNLMSVYGDAVFFPLLEKWTFEQEAHRYEFDAENKLTIQGVVYNEMKGNYSTLENVAADWSIRSLLPGTPYAFDSGGDPEVIPDLTWEQFCAFHKKWYHPANCRLFLYGNIPPEKQFAFVNERFLTHFEAPPAEFAALRAASFPPAATFTASRAFDIPGPAGNADETGATVLLSWLLCDSADMVSSMEAAFIVEILLGHDGSPLSKALLESGLGEDIAPGCGLETEIKQTVFSAGLRGVDRKRSAELEKLVFGVLNDIYKNGISAEEMETAILSLEFSNREIRRSSGPFSLTLMRRCLKGWLHGFGPGVTLLYEDSFDEVKKRLTRGPDYIRGLIDRFFLSNIHRCLLTVYPDKDYSVRVQKKLDARLAAVSSAMTEKDAAALRRRQKELLDIQQSPDSPEKEALIPHLKPADLPAAADSIKTEETELNGIPVFLNNQGTNGIAYLDLGLPVDVLPPEDYPYLSFFSSALTGTGFGGLDWASASSKVASAAGGFGAALFTSSAASGSGNLIGRSWLFFRIKMLEEKIPEAAAIVFDCLRTADFGDIKRLHDLVLEFRNDFDASIVPAGNQYAGSRASRRFSRAKAVDEIWNGLAQLYTAHRLADMDMTELSLKLSSIKDRLLAGGLVINMTGTPSVLEALRNSVSPLLAGFTPPAPVYSAEDSAFFALADNAGLSSVPAGGLSPEGTAAEVFAGSMQVGFAAAAFPCSAAGTPEAAQEGVFSHWLTNTLLWERIRTVGGAYGASASPDSLEKVCTLTTYRDPSPVRSCSVLKECLTAAAVMQIDRETLERAIAGSYSREIQPRSPSSRGFTGFLRRLYGITDEQRRAKLQALIETDAAQFRRTAERFLLGWNSVQYVLISDKKDVLAAKELFSSGKILELPL